MSCIGVGHMVNDTQLMKGILEGCMLKVMAGGQVYGYRAVEILRGYGFDVNEATVYPILLRLQNRGMLKVEKRPSPFGPDRKYYSLTNEGEAGLADFTRSWSKLHSTVSKIMEDDQND